uniref:Phosphoribosyl pyrophosphate synthetase-associated protein 2 n=1 Tax=Mus spicilegus TaxID=10103 RepID=A0A8C6HMA7_MUSSI
MFCVAPPELETKMNITKGGLVLFSANSNSSCMELSKKIAENKSSNPGVCERKRCIYHPNHLKVVNQERNQRKQKGQKDIVHLM